ncbi:hypothetical protein RP20_CCG015754 [Aedes albopictus]|nr:hypothetical protein RP20_CCG015754 [Aedes albopictus]
MPSPNQPTYHQLNSPSPNNPNATLHVMQPPQQSPQIPPQMSPQLGSGAPVGTGPGGYMGRSPPQPGGGGGGHHLNNNEPGTTSEDSDDAIPAVDDRRWQPAVVFRTVDNGRSGHVVYRPVSAYALFFRDTQAAIKGQSPNASFGEVSKIVASMWDVLATEHKNSINGPPGGRTVLRTSWIEGFTWLIRRERFMWGVRYRWVCSRLTGNMENVPWTAWLADRTDSLCGVVLQNSLGWLSTIHEEGEPSNEQLDCR